MNIGDTVVYTGTVKDKVTDKNNPSLVSVLTGAADLSNPAASDGKEYWFSEDHLKGVPTADELQAMATAAGYKLEKIPPPATGQTPASGDTGTTPAPTHATSTHKR